MKRLPIVLGVLTIVGLLLTIFRPSIPVPQQLTEVLVDSLATDTTVQPQPRTNQRTRQVPERQPTQPQEELPLSKPQATTDTSPSATLSREEKDQLYRDNNARWRMQATKVKDNLRSGITYVYNYDTGHSLSVRVVGFEPIAWPSNGDVRPKQIHLKIEDTWRDMTVYTTLNRDGRSASKYGSNHDGLRIYIELDFAQVSPCPKLLYGGQEMIPKGTY